jgi:hypothetical protein
MSTADYGQNTFYMLTKSHHIAVEHVEFVVADSVTVLHEVHISSITGFGHA